MENCIICGQEFEEDELTYPVDGRRGGYCEECSEDNLVNCDECGDWLENNYSELQEYDTLCENCNERLNLESDIEDSPARVNSSPFPLVMYNLTDILIWNDGSYIGFDVEEDEVRDLSIEVQKEFYNMISDFGITGMSTENKKWYDTFKK